MARQGLDSTIYLDLLDEVLLEQNDNWDGGLIAVGSPASVATVESQDGYHDETAPQAQQGIADGLACKFGHDQQQEARVSFFKVQEGYTAQDFLQVFQEDTVVATTIVVNEQEKSEELTQWNEGSPVAEPTTGELILQELGIRGWPAHSYMEELPEISSKATCMQCQKCRKPYKTKASYIKHFRDIHQKVSCGFCKATKDEKSSHEGYSAYYRHATNEDGMPKRYKTKKSSAAPTGK